MLGYFTLFCVSDSLQNIMLEAVATWHNAPEEVQDMFEELEVSVNIFDDPRCEPKVL